MNYTEIKDIAISYSDREDTEVIDRVDMFIKIVEGRLNRMLESIVSQEKAWLVPFYNTVIEEYELPKDFNGFRDVAVSTQSRKGRKLEYYTPSQFVDAKNNNSTTGIYCIYSGNLIIWPHLEENEILDCSYKSKIVPLSADDPNNFISDNYPDCYVFGILVEINSFVKDAEASRMWDARFKEAVEEVEYREKSNKWSGVPLVTRVTSGG